MRAGRSRPLGLLVTVPSPPPAVTETLPDLSVEEGLRSRRRRRRGLAGLVGAVAIAAIVQVIVDPLGGGASSPGGATHNAFATSLQRVTEQGLSAQTQVGGTLGFAGDWTIRVPVGTAPSAVAHALDSVSAARRALTSARSSLAADQPTLSNARAALAADEQQLAVGCAGDNSAQRTSSTSQSPGIGGGCATDVQLVSSSRRAQTEAAGAVAADRGRVSSAGRSLAAARAALAGAQARETGYQQSSIYTALPSPGRTVVRGQSLYAIDGQSVLLLYGSVVARRAFVAGMAPGQDVAELNANLDALGYGHELAGDSFTTATAAAILALQHARGARATGALPVGSVVFEPGAVRVTSVVPNTGVGSTVSPGPLLTVSSTGRVVTIRLDTSLEGQVKVGDPVIITLPDNNTTPGRISYISKVAVSGQNGTTVEVHAVPSDPAATGTLDQAPVNVQITTASVPRALVVPVDALEALAGGGYAVEEVSHGRHDLVRVHTGLFDDADGLVQIRGARLAAGQQVVVPGT